MSATEQRIFAKLVATIGETEAKAFFSVDMALRQMMLKDLEPVWNRWQDEADRLCSELGSTKKPTAGVVFAMAMLSVAAATMVQNNIMSKAEFLDACDATYDAIGETVAKMKRLD